MRNRIFSMSIAALAVVFTFSGCVDRNAQQEAKRTSEVVNDPLKDVTTASLKQEPVSETIEVNGEVATSTDANVGAKSPGKLAAVYVREGDAVTQGQLLATLDSSNLLAQATQARSQLSAARAQLSQADNNARLTPMRTQAAVLQAQAQLRQAKSQLLKLENGARTEEKAQSDANVRSAKSNLETQKKELDRVKALVASGAIAANRLDSQLNVYEQALAQYQSALEANSITKNSSRPEDIESAKEAVKQAEQGVASALASKSLDVVLKDQVNAARAQMQSAQAQLAIIEQQIADTRNTAPFSGRVAGKPLQAGVSVGSGTPIVRLVGMQGIYFEGEVASDLVGKVKSGASVQIHVDAIPDKSYEGTVISVNPLADSVGRLFKTRVQFKGTPAEVSPGMFAKGSITLRTIPDAILVPASSVIKRGSDTWVMVAKDGVAKKVPVKTGIAKGSSIQVIGLSLQEKLIVDGQIDLVDGKKIRAKDQATEKSAAEKGI